MRRVFYFLCALCVLILYPAANASAEYHTVIVLSQGDHTVYDVDSASGKIVNQIQLGGVPTAAVFSWDEQSVFVAVPDQGYISVINAHTFKETSRLTKPEFKSAANSAGIPDALATTPDYKKLYVSVPGGLEVFDQHLLVLDPEYKQPDKKYSLPGTDGQHMLVHGPTNKLYYTFRRENQVVVIDTNTDTVLKTIAVKGGPTDVAFNFGGEAWITAADGSISIIDTDKDEVVKTIDTGGKGAGRITVAPDVRYIAASHDDSGDVTILQPLTKAIVGTLKVDKGPLSVAFAPAGHGVTNFEMKNPTNQLYVTTQSGLAIVDLDKMTVGTSQKIGQNLTSELIHYTYPDAFRPPREATESRVLETEIYTLYNNAMSLYDVSPVHEHRTDMIAVFTGDGVAKIGCWDDEEDPKCPDYAIRPGPDGHTYSINEGRAGTFTGVPRGTLHVEDGLSPSPRRMMIFMPKNNYYRQTNPKQTSVFGGQPGFTKFYENSRAWLWNLDLTPGHPVHFPKTDYAFVFLAGGMMRVTHDGVPEIVNKYYADTDSDASDRTVEAISNRIHIVVIEFK